MKANRPARDDAAGAETVGAILLFGLFVTVIAYLNVTAVPDAGLKAEEAHYEDVLGALNALQASTEATATPSGVGATASGGFPLSPTRTAGQDFFSFFLAEPALASGEIAFLPDYGNVTVHHYRLGKSDAVVDVGSFTERLPVGRLTFDPHPVFRGAGVAQLEGGGVVTTEGDASSLRFAPPVSVTVSGSTTNVAVKARILNGTAQNAGGSTDIRVALDTEAATLTSPAKNNAQNVTFRLETSYGSAWGAYLNATATAAGLASGSGFETAVSRGTGEGGLDVVTWLVHGTGSGNDVRLTTGIAVHRVRLS